MNDTLRVLVTGGGAPGIVGTLYALRNNPDGRLVKIIACDARDNVIGKYLADEFFVIPSADDPYFIDMLLHTAIKTGANIILPQVTRELLPLSKNRHRFEKYGIKVLVSNEESIEKSNDKWETIQVANSSGVPCPESVLTRSEEELISAVEKFGYPENKVVVKPRLSNGLRGLRILSKETWTVERFLSSKPDFVEISLENLISILRNGDWPELIVQEYLPGLEYTVDVFRGDNGIVAIPRLRKEIRSGITFRAKIDLRQDVQKFSINLAEALDLKYAFGFQFKLSKDGIPKLLECNPRVQGTMVTSVFAGCNVIWWAVKEVLGEKVKPTLSQAIDSLEFIRYWGGIAVYGDGETKGLI